MNRKVTVVGGAGNVGATVARAIAEKELADVVIIDIADQKAAGIALDIYETCPIIGSDSRVIGGGDWGAAAGSDIVVITSGKPRKPGMSRDDLVRDNFDIMKSIAPKVVEHCPDAIIIPVANPLDAMAQALFRLTKFPRERIIGMAGVLDSARMSTFIAMELERLGRERPLVRARRPRRHDGAAAALLDGGRHSDHRAAVEGADRRDREAHRQRRRRDHEAGRHERVVCARRRRRRRWCEAILKDKKKILPCSVFLQGEYGIRDLFVGVPVKLGARGVEQIIEIKLTPEEDAALKKSAARGQGTGRRHRDVVPASGLRARGTPREPVARSP